MTLPGVDRLPLRVRLVAALVALVTVAMLAVGLFSPPAQAAVPQAKLIHDQLGLLAE